MAKLFEPIKIEPVNISDAGYYEVTTDSFSGEVEHLGQLAQNFKDADTATTRIRKTAKTNTSEADQVVTLSTAGSIPGKIELKFVKLGKTVIVYTDANGKRGFGNAGPAILTDAGSEVLQKDLRPVGFPVILHFAGIGTKGHGYTGTLLSDSRQFVRINPDGTIDVQAQLGSVFDALGSDVIFWAVSGQYNVGG